MSTMLLALALALYLLTAASFVGLVISGHRALHRIAFGLLAGAFAMHAAALALRAGSLGYQALAPFQETLSFVACIAVGLYLTIAMRTDFTVVGALMAPVAFLFTLSGYVFESETQGGGLPLPQHLKNFWLPAHVAPAFVGYAIFTVAFCLSMTYVVQERQLKAKRKSDLFRRLPSLETLDELNHRFVKWGFALFTIGLLTGSMLAKETWGALWSWEPVQVWSLVTWLLYALLLQARFIGWRGRKAAALTIVGFVILIASFFTVNLVFPGKHGGSFG
ncbi:MAG TPA: cytochrome c biogenesis protein CcsA [Terriglobales bacterium]|nr:cytochrome c biogenesis protein CcsA [Terriglobales bacterium]